MRTIIHDLNDISFLNLNDDDVLLNENYKNCIGCFTCWKKTPLKCIHNDKIQENGKTLLNSDELIIITKCIDGSYSSKVKRVLERSISYVEPFFTLRNNHLHHKVRTKKKLIFKVYFYNERITDEDKEVSKRLVLANMDNLNTQNPEIFFIDDYKEIIL